MFNLTDPGIEAHFAYQPDICQLASVFSLYKLSKRVFQPLMNNTDMALALNRYMCHSVLPLLVKHVHLLASCQYRVQLIDQLLHTMYRMSRGKALTKAQKEMISNCLVAVAR